MLKIGGALLWSPPLPGSLQLFDNDVMAVSSGPPRWLHRGCSVELVGHPLHEDAYVIQHCSGAVLGSVASLTAARDLIDERLPLVRQRLLALV